MNQLNTETLHNLSEFSSRRHLPQFHPDATGGPSVSIEEALSQIVSNTLGDSNDVDSSLRDPFAFHSDTPADVDSPFFDLPATHHALAEVDSLFFSSNELGVPDIHYEWINNGQATHNALASELIDDSFDAMRVEQNKSLTEPLIAPIVFSDADENEPSESEAVIDFANESVGGFSNAIDYDMPNADSGQAMPLPVDVSSDLDALGGDAEVSAQTHKDETPEEREIRETLLALRAQFIDEISANGALTAKDKSVAIELLDGFSMDWKIESFQTASLRAYLISDPEVRVIVNGFFENAKHLVV